MRAHVRVCVCAHVCGLGCIHCKNNPVNFTVKKRHSMLLPGLIGDKIVNPSENETWQLILQLREIVELVCAPAVSTGQIAYLRVLIDEYLHTRWQSFPNHPLKPKHHYISHYPDLIFHFGPLIHLWTMRFESKHSYFKQCACKSHNFKNLCRTLAEKHQLFQAYLYAGSYFPQDI